MAAGPDRSYLEWIVAKDFPIHVREIAHRALSLDRPGFEEWIRGRYSRDDQAVPSAPHAPEAAAS